MSRGAWGALPVKTDRPCSLDFSPRARTTPVQTPMEMHMSQFSRRQFTLLAAGAGLASLARPAFAASETHVVLLLSGSIADGGWGQQAYEGLKSLEGKPGFKISYAENVSQAQIPQVARGYADDGAQLIIGHGFEFGSALLEVAPDYPETAFFVSSFLPEPDVPSNLLFVDLAYFDAAYLAGALAALLSTKKAVGFVGGGDNPTQQTMMKAFGVGAGKTVPDTTALGIVTGDYDDAAKGKQAAATMIGNGADVIWHAANVTGLGAIQAAAEAPGVKALGCYSDQLDLAPEVIGTSFAMNLAGMVTTVAGTVADGSFKGGTEWRPTVDQIWVLKAGPGRDHNPAVIPDATWAQFMPIWNDVAARKIDVGALLK